MRIDKPQLSFMFFMRINKLQLSDTLFSFETYLWDWHGKFICKRFALKFREKNVGKWKPCRSSFFPNETRYLLESIFKKNLRFLTQNFHYIRIVENFHCCFQHIQSFRQRFKSSLNFVIIENRFTQNQKVSEFWIIV